MSDKTQTGNQPAPKDEQADEFLSQVIKLNGHILGLTLAMLFGLALFVATNVLVLKGGEHVGAHLGLLSQFFPGYRVTFPGSLVGMFYGGLVGYFSGWLVGTAYNAVVWLRGRLK